MPSGKDISNYDFIKRSRQLFEKYWGLDITIPNFNYTNLCSFRSPREDILVDDDYVLSIPLFKKYINYINPPWILSIGVKNINVLKKLGYLENIIPHFDKQKKFKGHSGKLWAWNLFSIPHPNARISPEARQTIWEHITAEKRKATNR